MRIALCDLLNFLFIQYPSIFTLQLYYRLAWLADYHHFDLLQQNAPFNSFAACEHVTMEALSNVHQ